MIVIEASVWIGLALPHDAHHSPSAEWAKPYLASGQTIAIPSLFLVEFAAGVVRRTGSEARAQEGVTKIQHDPMFEVVDLDMRLLQLSIHTAISSRLRAADAVYVALAQHLGIPLVTWDAEQRERASRIIEVWTPTEALERMA